MINAKKATAPRLSLQFENGEINFYSCSVRFIEEPLNEVYDWPADVLNEAWDAKAARKKLKAQPERLVCDALLDQSIFSGVGNIIKNEVLFRIKV
ncbi:MAG: endonuclease, partial [Chitinophagaceae bacterium]